MFDSAAGLVSVLTYRDVGLPGGLQADYIEEQTPLETPAGLDYEREVERRVAQSSQESAQYWQRECDRRVEAERNSASELVASAIQRFQQERKSYFEHIEIEIVRLAFAIARKILQREAEVNPDLMGALVRIALDRMQSGPAVRVRVHPNRAAHWKAMANGSEKETRWTVVEDATVLEADCIVDTESGSAHFGFEAQMASLEETFAHLLARRPNR